MKGLTVKYSFFLLLLGLVFISSCSRRPKDILSISEMTDVLVDMHAADGVFSTDEYRYLDNNQKSFYYYSILDKYHITQAQFDSSVVWYSRDPKKYEKIYGRVIDRLTIYENEVKSGKYHSILEGDTLPSYAELNLWKDTVRYVFSEKKGRDPLDFVIKDSALLSQDTYTLKFIQSIEPQDSCGNQTINFRIHYADGKNDTLLRPVSNDGLVRKYTLRLIANRDIKIDSLSGSLLTGDSCSGLLQYALVDSISLVRSYNPSAQDSIRKRVESLEQLRTSPYIIIPRPVKDSWLYYIKTSPVN